MKTRRVKNGVLTAAAAVAVLTGLMISPALAQDKVASGRVAQQAETTLAAQLAYLHQPNLVKAMAAGAAKRTGRGDLAAMWKSQEILATWDEIATTRTAIKKNAEDYVASVNAYLESIKQLKVPNENNAQVQEVADGFWAVVQMRFMTETMSSLVVARIEANGINERDREELLPIATLALKMCDIADDGLLAIIEDDQARPGAQARLNVANGALALFTKASDMQGYPGYFRNFARYYKALSLEPGSAERKELLTKTIKEMSENWIDGEGTEDTAVRDQSYLLRAKCYMELGGAANTANALKDLAAVQLPINAPDKKTPIPVTMYQARFQMVVAKARNNDFAGARTELDGLRKNSPLKAQNKEEEIYADVSLKLLNFRIDWLEAESKPEAAKAAARLAALKPLGDLANTVPDSYRSMVYEVLIAQVSQKDEQAALSGQAANILPLQALAMSYNRYQLGKGDKLDKEKKTKSLQEAIKLAELVRTSTQNKKDVKWQWLEATYVAAAASVENDERENATKYCLDYADEAPADDKRLRPMATEAITQLDKIREKAGGKLPDAAQPLVSRAVVVMGERLKEPKWQYALGGVYNKQYDIKKDSPDLLQKADDAYQRVAKDDPNYVDSMFQRLGVSSKRMAFFQNDPVKAKDAAQKFLASCTEFRKMVDEPNSTIPKDALERAKSKLMDLTLWEIAVSLDPLKDAKNVLDRVAGLEKQLGAGISEDQQASFLQYRIKAYNLLNQGENAVKAVDEYTRKNPEKGAALIEYMVAKWFDDITQAEGAKNADKVQTLSRQLADLLTSMIKITQAQVTSTPKEDEEKKDKVFKFRKFQGKTLVKGGRYQEAIDLFDTLLKEKGGEDAFCKLWKANALFYSGKYLDSQTIYVDLIKRLPSASDGWWESWYRMIMANEALLPTSSATDKTKREEQNLDALNRFYSMYGKEIGGTKFNEEFMKLLKDKNLLQ